MVLASPAFAAQAAPAQATADPAAQPPPNIIKTTHIGRITSPVAIAMWDFSWLVRRNPGEGFENWEQRLDELVERGYNAVRIDVFPEHLALPGRNIPEELTFAGEGKKTCWGNEKPITVNPRKELVLFLKACEKRHIYVELSTWFLGAKSVGGKIPGASAGGEQGFIRVWEETIDFLEKQGLMGHILFIDLCNEYPNWHGFGWLRQEAGRAAGQQITDDGTAHFLQNAPAAGATPEGRAFCKAFSTRILKHFKSRYPKYDFALCVSPEGRTGGPILDHITNTLTSYVDLEAMDVLDNHIWFNLLNGGDDLDLRGEAHLLEMNPAQRADQSNAIKASWAAKKPDLTIKMQNFIAASAAIGRQHHAYVGNTEGWGTISWDPNDFPEYDWSFIKEGGEIAVDAAIANDYRFICTSNFTEPQFPRMWADVAWHKAITAKIKSHKFTHPSP
jgi:hypothetical protein